MIYKLKDATDASDKALKEYFKKPKKEREKISKVARDYALRNYSHEVWKEPHTKAYLY